MKKYLIRFNSFEVLAIIAVTDGADMAGTQQAVITTLERAATMLTAIGVDITKLAEYQEPEGE